jgi:AAA domain
VQPEHLQPLRDEHPYAATFVEEIGHKLPLDVLDGILRRSHDLDADAIVVALDYAAELARDTPSSNGADHVRERRPWLLDAADLLAEPDPGPTPWLVDELIVDAAIVAAVGRWKTTKSYGLLDLCVCVAAGAPVFGDLAVPTPGPVVFVNEESGRAALWRRLDALARGRALDRERLRGKLHVAANARVKLDDEGWQNELLAVGRDLRPRLFVFDPLARMKAPGREENEQTSMGVIVEFLRELRDISGAAVCFVHHTGHAGGHMRGTSDLESVWETRLTWTRDGQSPLVTLAAEHREAEAGGPLDYRIQWDATTRTIRFDRVRDDPALPPLAERIIDYIRDQPGTTDEVAKGVGIRRSDVKRELEKLEHAGTAHRVPTERRDAAGRVTRPNLWNLSQQATLPFTARRPDSGTAADGAHPAHREPSHRPVSLETGGTDGAPDATADTEPEPT